MGQAQPQRVAPRPRSPSAAHAAGAEAVTLVNTVLGMAIDPETRAYRLGRARGAGDCRARPSTRWRCGPCTTSTPRCPTLPIVGVGGVANGGDAVELLLAGASAVQVGTATFADPRAPGRVLDELERWAARHGVPRVRDVIGAVHG